MHEKRLKELMIQLADGFYNGTDLLLSTEWLAKNEITFDECMHLSERISACIRVASELEPKLFGFYFGVSTVTSPPKNID